MIRRWAASSQFPKLIRQLDVATLTGLVAEIEARLATSGN